MLALTVLTSMLTTLVVSNAYYKKRQFYPTVVYLLNSNRSLGVLYLQGFLVVWVLCDFLKRLFFGTLRAAEVEVNALKHTCTLEVANCLILWTGHIWPMAIVVFLFYSVF